MYKTYNKINIKYAQNLLDNGYLEFSKAWKNILGIPKKVTDKCSMFCVTFKRTYMLIRFDHEMKYYHILTSEELERIKIMQRKKKWNRFYG